MPVFCLLLSVGLLMLMLYFRMLPVYDSLLFFSVRKTTMEDELPEDHTRHELNAVRTRLPEARGSNHTKKELNTLRSKLQELANEKRQAFEEDDLNRALEKKLQAEEVTLEISKLEAMLLEQLQQEALFEKQDEDDFEHGIQSGCHGIVRSFDVSCRQIGSVEDCMEQMVCQWSDAQIKSCHPASDDLWLGAACTKLNRTACDQQMACKWAIFAEIYKKQSSQSFIFHDCATPQTSSVLWFFIAFFVAFFDIAFRPFSSVRPNRDMCDKYLDACAGMCLTFLGLFGGLLIGVAVSMCAMVCNFLHFRAIAGNTVCSLFTVAIIYLCECSFPT